MRSLIIGLVVFLAACGGGGTTIAGITQAQLDAAVKPLQAQVDSLQTQNKSLQDSLAKLTLIGKVHGVSSELRMQGEFRTEAVAAPSFGPCADMGVLVGFTAQGSNTADPLTASNEAFKQCTGYSYESVVGTGALAPTQRLYFDGPNCTGNMYVWPASGAGYNAQILQDGVVFSSPIDGSGMMVKAGQVASMIQAASVYIILNAGCSIDGDLQPMWNVTANDISITGVSSNAVGAYQLAAP